MIFEHKFKGTDEAMITVSDMLAELICVDGYMVEEQQGVSTSLESIEIELPVELDVVTDDRGRVTLASAPPLYHLETTLMPVFHQVRIRTLIQKKE